jgi:hypothetical protein
MTKKLLYFYKENNGDNKLLEFVDLMDKYVKQTEHICEEINTINFS